MRTLSLLLPLGAVLAVTPVVAQDSPKAVVEKAIQAQGGADKVAKLRTMRIKVEGTADLIPGQAKMPLVIEDVWMMPDRYKTTATFELMGMKLTQTQVLSRDGGWISVAGRTQDMPKEAATEMREQKWAEDLDRLGFLGEPGIELSALPDAEVGGKPAVGVLAKAKGHRDVKLYFDKETGLLVKREHKVYDPATTKEVTQAVVFADYKEKDGLKHYHTITAYRDGKKVIEGKVTEVEFFDKLDDKVFAKP